MSFAMTEQERNAFIAEVRIGLLSLNDPDPIPRGPLSSPVWYDHDADRNAIWFLTQTTSRKGKLIAIDTPLTLTMQTETAPYRYVSVEGLVSAIEPYDLAGDLLAMASRYLGAEGGRNYVDNDRAGWNPATSIKVTMTPRRWLSVDYSKR